MPIIISYTVIIFINLYNLLQDAVSYTSDLNDPTVEEVCQVLKLEDYLPTFQREEFTFSDLLLLSDEDLACLKLPMGPRRRLMTYVSSCSSCLQLPGW